MYKPLLMAAELKAEKWYYCALCDGYHETFRFLRDDANGSADLIPPNYVLTAPGSITNASSATGGLEFRPDSKLTSDI